MAELKPCPFCGRTPTVDDCGDHRYFVRCKCGIAQDKLYAQKCDAIRRWNTRKTVEIANDTNVPSNDCISRQTAIEAFKKELTVGESKGNYVTICSAVSYIGAKQILESLPAAQPTLYGYNIEHLAYIARVMRKEGVTAEYTVRTFDDMSRAIRMIIEETQQKVEEALNERFNQPAGGD